MASAYDFYTTCHTNKEVPRAPLTLFCSVASGFSCTSWVDSALLYTEQENQKLAGYFKTPLAVAREGRPQRTRRACHA